MDNPENLTLTQNVNINSVVDIQTFGAKSTSEDITGTFDNTVPIQQVINFASMNSISTVDFGTDTYNIATLLKLKGDIKYTGNGSTLVINDGFNSEGGEFAITNYNSSTSYNESTSDALIIDGLNIKINQSVLSIKSGLGLSNIKSLSLNNSKISAVGTTAVTCLDLYAVVKNANITNCEFDNTTLASAGRCVWVRNITKNASLVENKTENITIDNCKFNKSSGDEALVIYSVLREVNGVTVKNTEFNFTNYKSAIPLSVYSNVSGVYVKNVEFSKNIINVDDFSSRLMMLSDTSSAGSIDNVLIDNNIINAKVSITGTTKLISTGAHATNISVTNNTITNTGATAIYTGVVGATTASNNSIKGTFSEPAINNCNVASYNTVDGASIGNFNYTLYNTIKNTFLGVKITNTGNLVVAGNTISLLNSASSAGVPVQNLGQTASLCNVNVIRNSITCANTSARMLFNAVGTMNTKSNTYIGSTATYGTLTPVLGKDIINIITPSTIEVAVNSVRSLSDIILPNTVTVTFDDGTTGTVSVTWNTTSSPTFSANTAGTYTITGTVTPELNQTNLEGTTVTQTIKVS